MGRFFELLISLAMVGIALLGWLESGNIKGFAFDPLGSRVVPQTLSALLLLVAVWILATSLRRRGAAVVAPPAEDEVPPSGADYARAIGMFALSVGFAFATFSMRLPVSICVIVFSLLGAQLLAPVNRMRATVIAAFAGLILGFGAEWVFTRFFVVDLPTLW